MLDRLILILWNILKRRKARRKRHRDRERERKSRQLDYKQQQSLTYEQEK